MRLAIPIWGHRISPVLDTASNLLVVEIEDQRETSRSQTFLDENDTSRRCLRIRSLEIDTLLCGAVSRVFLRMLSASGIHVIPEISGPTEDIIKAYLQGGLFRSRFQMPGCRRKRLDRQGQSGIHNKRCLSGRRRKGRTEKRDRSDERE
jgi:predicted Fe-Mo cluster-binding NifX family protein